MVEGCAAPTGTEQRSHEVAMRRLVELVELHELAGRRDRPKPIAGSLTGRHQRGEDGTVGVNQTGTPGSGPVRITLLRQWLTPPETGSMLEKCQVGRLH